MPQQENYNMSDHFSRQLREMLGQPEEPIQAINNDMDNYYSKNFENKENSEWESLKESLKKETLRVRIKLNFSCWNKVDGKFYFDFDDKPLISDQQGFMFDVYVNNKDYREAFNVALSKLKLHQLEKITL